MSYERSNMGELAGMYEVSGLASPSPSIAEENTGECRDDHRLELPAFAQAVVRDSSVEHLFGEYEAPFIACQITGRNFVLNCYQEQLLERWESGSLVIDPSSAYEDEDDQDPGEDNVDTDWDDHWDDERDIRWS